MIEHWDESQWGPLSEENLRTKLIEDGYPSVFCYTYPRGMVFAEHTHSVGKKDAVLEGEFSITIEGKEFLLRAGDMIEIPSNTVHKAEVMGNHPVVSLDATSPDYA
jgi:mannose-6-phosphate isomerase-like protein (cupin superfamily)